MKKDLRLIIITPENIESYDFNKMTDDEIKRVVFPKNIPLYKYFNKMDEKKFNSIIDVSCRFKKLEMDGKK